MEQWHSGLIAYPILLVTQVAIIVLLAAIGLDVSRGSGFFARRGARFAGFVRCFSYVYAASMAMRYAGGMYLHPDWRWFGHTIPIVFHWVLALYLFVYSRWLTARALRAGPPGARAIGAAGGGGR